MKIPDWFPDYIHGLNDNIRLGMLYRALVMREPGNTALVYTCHHCGHIFSSTKVYEEVANCTSCSSVNLTSSVQRPFPKTHETTTRELVNHSISQLTNLKSLYAGKDRYIEARDYGFCKTGYYFQFTGIDAVKAEATTFKNAIYKAALLNWFLWDFDFDWSKVGVRNIKIYNVLSILY